jgi:uncharacterized LabA/DUF88 family protein
MATSRPLFDVTDMENPHRRRWMLFVDGENFTMSAQRVVEKAKLILQEGPYYIRDTFVWFPPLKAATAMRTGAGEFTIPLQRHATRAHYYTSVQGDEPKAKKISEALWDVGFAPKVFKKDRTRSRSKGVDIALTTDMLSHAFRDNYDVAFLYAGDGDYVPLVEEVKRLGKIVYVSFFGGSGLNDKLRLASDNFFLMDDAFLEGWRRYLNLS